MSEENLSLGKVLRQAREERGLTGPEVSTLLAEQGVRLSAQTIYALEKESHNVGHKYVEPLAKVLHIRPSRAWELYRQQPGRRGQVKGVA